MQTTKERVLALLGPGAQCSGASISRALGVSRTAVWQAVESLRAEGYEIEARTRLGYRLLARPDLLTPEEIRRFRTPETTDLPIAYHARVDSTNRAARQWALAGAPHGAAVVADEQTAGRGRFGRPFLSPPGAGLYLSLVLRPDWPPERLPLLTVFVAVAACDAIAAVAGRRPQVKWVNDLLMGGRKLAGILTELSLEGESGRVDSAVVGIGLNCHAVPFPEDLAAKATSLEAETGRRICRAQLAAALLDRLFDMAGPRQPEHCANDLARYRTDCVTPGRRVSVSSPAGTRLGQALTVTDSGALTVRFDDGHTEDLPSGEVSLHGD
ncbi:MAG: biotin--[acetyl-CoA-carboxylase] ligase [Oscillospiraceae bacterium]|nr:biotin--[acetyl-CoA-carboxylase] ligase [Oscillospiraceae bacterium]